MKLMVSLGKYGTGAMAHIEDDECSTLCVGGGTTSSPRAACMSAARALRAAASRFEMLAKEAEPYHVATHNRINRRAAGRD